MSSIIHHTPPKKEEWTQKLGAVAWAPHPIINNNQTQPWPCLIYTSWSIAVLNSGLFPTYHHRQHDADNDGDSHSSSSRGSGDDKTLAILFCKKKVKLSDLARNRVPIRVALNPGKNDDDATSRTSSGHNDSSSRTSSSRKSGAKKRRTKVVVHFLGVNEWSVASIGDLTQYTPETALTFLRRFRNNRHPGGDDDDGLKICSSVGLGHTNGRGSSIENNNNKKRKINDWWDNWLLAMKEASIACEREDTLDPSFLLFQCKDIDGTAKNTSRPSSCENTAAISTITTREMTHSSNNKIVAKSKLQMGEQRAPMQLLKNSTEQRKQVEDNEKTEFTPECFDDWRVGGNTEKLSGTSQSQFLLISQSKTQ